MAVTPSCCVRSVPGDSTLRSYMIIWVKDGMLYSLRGYRDPQEGLLMADSLE